MYNLSSEEKKQLGLSDDCRTLTITNDTNLSLLFQYGLYNDRSTDIFGDSGYNGAIEKSFGKRIDKVIFKGLNNASPILHERINYRNQHGLHGLDNMLIHGQCVFEDCCFTEPKNPISMKIRPVFPFCSIKVQESSLIFKNSTAELPRTDIRCTQVLIDNSSVNIRGLSENEELIINNEKSNKNETIKPVTINHIKSSVVNIKNGHVKIREGHISQLYIRGKENHLIHPGGRYKLSIDYSNVMPTLNGSQRTYTSTSQTDDAAPTL